MSRKELDSMGYEYTFVACVECNINAYAERAWERASGDIVCEDCMTQQDRDERDNATAEWRGKYWEA